VFGLDFDALALGLAVTTANSTADGIANPLGATTLNSV